MNSPDQNATKSDWPCLLITIGFLIAAGAIVAAHDGKPPSGWLITLVACIGMGAAFGVIPLLAREDRKKTEALDDRQRALEAISRTVASSAEQLSIAANGLHEIADLAQKNLRQAEQLPHKLQEKVAGFQAQLAQASDAEKEELERELLALRTTESERLESVSQRIAKSAAEWARLEAATQQHLTAVTEALGKLQLGTANAIGKAQAAAEQALTQARVEAARQLGEASGNAIRAIESARDTALSDLEARIAAAARNAADLLTREFQAALTPSVRPTTPAAGPAIEPVAVAPTIAPAPTPAPEPPPATTPDTTTPPVASAPKRPRKTRREETAPEPATPPVPADAPPPAFEEPTPIPAARIAEITPVAPHTAPPFSVQDIASNGGHRDPAPAVSETEPARAPRRKSPKKSEADADSEPGLGLDLDDPSSRAAAAGILERVLSSDGATRLLVTAYIGIGNRLFIRGEGPGLTWDKGVPLQFVSIGKWRWETNDASGPVQFKLYKNDDLECSSLGTQTLEPGHQQEVTAAF